MKHGVNSKVNTVYVYFTSALSGKREVLPWQFQQSH